MKQITLRLVHYRKYGFTNPWLLEWKRNEQGHLMLCFEHDAECPECKGTGVTLCDCCGHEVDCDNCNGSWYVRGRVWVRARDYHADKSIVDRMPTRQEAWERAYLRRIYGTEHPPHIRDYWMKQPVNDLTVWRS